MEKKGTYCYEYPRPAVTVDCIIFGKDDSGINVLLIERGNEPFKGKWALPGGFVDMDETTEQAAARELKEETGLENVILEQLHTFSAVDRDPRGRSIAVAYYSLVNRSEHNVAAGDDASKAQWFPVNKIPELAFDHDVILKYALNKTQI